MTDPALVTETAPEAAAAAVLERKFGDDRMGVGHHLKPGSPLFGYALIFVPGIVGLIANDEAIITALWPPRWLWPPNWLRGEIYWPAALFVLLLLCMMALAEWERRHRNRQKQESTEQVRRALTATVEATAKQLESDRLRREAEIRRDAALDELQARAARIEDKQGQAPPPQFLLGYLEAFEASHAGHLLVLTTPVARLNAAHVTESIRTVLFSLARLVQIFEGARAVCVRVRSISNFTFSDCEARSSLPPRVAPARSLRSPRLPSG